MKFQFNPLSVDRKSPLLYVAANKEFPFIANLLTSVLDRPLLQTTQFFPKIRGEKNSIG